MTGETLVTSGQLYWITRLDGLLEFMRNYSLVTVVVVGCLGGFGLFIIHCEEAGSKFFRAAMSVLFALVVCSGVIVAIARPFVPTTKEAVLIYGLPAVVNDARVQEKAGAAIEGTEDLLKLAKGYLAEKMKTAEAPKQGDAK